MIQRQSMSTVVGDESRQGFIIPVDAAPPQLQSQTSDIQTNISAKTVIAFLSIFRLYPLLSGRTHRSQ